ncbi:DUF262 domain-containing protein [Wenyingzhuangia aestuarii]|uniref:DUF262 domain-containing protein n=1 Tax=Wenyingzhuangia aestuarii TaxID=1647582 RepID=UPI001438FC2B|nr:DUF262 domain-containing protein [Wenyingzhuangia aestuarii]NJB81723.1 uncharacterized protein with ParB-like and HNH nuclease domain [Wenyingzhuangia aestuarii]
MKGIQGTSNDTYRKLMGSGLKYEIPKFQRDYSWGSQQWDDLWQDISLIISDEENEHYMGYLVLQTSDNKLHTVIDGQQRLTTLSILMLSILKVLNEFVENEIEVDDNKLRIETYRNNYIGSLNTITLISDNKLKLNRNGDEYYRNNMVLLKDLPLRNTNSSEKNMRECFLWFHNKASKLFTSGQDVAEFVETIVDKLFFTVITVTDQLNAFKVFETLNARGVQLSSSDLLKNYLFSVIDESNPHGSEIEELESLWSRIIGKLGNKKFEDYLRYYWNSKNKTVRKNQLFKTIRNTIKTKEDTFKLIRDLDDTADLFVAIQDPESEYWIDNQEIKKQLNELNLFQIKQTNSLLIAGYKNLDSREFLKLVKVSVIISFRYNIIGGLNPNDQEEVYNKMANNITLNKTLDLLQLSSIYVNDHNFENAFSNKQFKRTSRNHKIVKYIFSKIENFSFQNEINPESDLYTIEHILPESADENWGSFSNEEITRSIYRLGNLTLLEKRLNQKAGTSNYEFKKEILEKSNCNLTKIIPENYETWSERKLIARQKELSKSAKSIWKIQELD